MLIYKRNLRQQYWKILEIIWFEAIYTCTYKVKWINCMWKNQRRLGRTKNALKKKTNNIYRKSLIHVHKFMITTGTSMHTSNALRFDVTYHFYHLLLIFPIRVHQVFNQTCSVNHLNISLISPEHKQQTYSNTYNK